MGCTVISFSVVGLPNGAKEGDKPQVLYDSEFLDNCLNWRRKYAGEDAEIKFVRLGK